MSSCDLIDSIKHIKTILSKFECELMKEDVNESFNEKKVDKVLSNTEYFESHIKKEEDLKQETMHLCETDNATVKIEITTSEFTDEEESNISTNKFSIAEVKDDNFIWENCNYKFGKLSTLRNHTKVKHGMKRNGSGLKNFKKRIRKCHAVAGSGLACSDEAPPPNYYLCTCQMLLGVKFIGEYVNGNLV